MHERLLAHFADTITTGEHVLRRVNPLKSMGTILAAKAPEKLCVSMIYIKHQLGSKFLAMFLHLLGATPTCLDCSSVISSDAFIPFKVINLWRSD
jgi:hypothetical protein